MRIARVFPSRTRATPDDELAFFDGPGLFPPAVDEVHVSVTFSWDIPRAEQLARQWEDVAPVKIGGRALRMRGDDFTPGRYLKRGYVITSRGCPEHCWHCDVWRIDGTVRALPITDGWNVLDDNLLACPEEHVRKVFAMLSRQPQRVEFTGGLQPHRLKAWHVDLLAQLKPKQMFFAYDTPDDYEPLVEAGKMLDAGGFRDASHGKRCYVLIGWKRDTFAAAEQRLWDTMRAGFLPMAMLYRDKAGKRDPQWRRFQREYAKPAFMSSKYRELRTNAHEDSITNWREV